MTSLIIVDGDRLRFDNVFDNRMVFIEGIPKIIGTGHASIAGKSICIKGDENSVKFEANYTSGPYTVPGRGLVTILELHTSQISPRCKSIFNVIVEGNANFTAYFIPSQAALNPTTIPNPTPDPNYSIPSKGKGWFITSQKFVKAG